MNNSHHQRHGRPCALHALSPPTDPSTDPTQTSYSRKAGATADEKQALAGLMSNATLRHRELATAASGGLGVDRHLFSLVPIGLWPVLARCAVHTKCS